MDQVEQDGTLAGAGLADKIKVPATFLGIERDRLARDPDTDAELLM